MPKEHQLRWPLISTTAQHSRVHTCMYTHMQREIVCMHMHVCTYAEREIVKVQKAPELLDSCQKQSNYDRLMEGTSYTASPKTLVF